MDRTAEEARNAGAHVVLSPRQGKGNVVRHIFEVVEADIYFFGNRLIALMISRLFGIRVTDMLSGYCAFRRSFVKGVPLFSSGFEIETELTLQTAARRLHLVESPIFYRNRPPGCYSKLNTITDGILVFRPALEFLEF